MRCLLRTWIWGDGMLTEDMDMGVETSAEWKGGQVGGVKTSAEWKGGQVGGVKTSAEWKGGQVGEVKTSAEWKNGQTRGCEFLFTCSQLT